MWPSKSEIEEAPVALLEYWYRNLPDPHNAIEERKLLLICKRLQIMGEPPRKVLLHWGWGCAGTILLIVGLGFLFWRMS